MQVCTADVDEIGIHCSRRAVRTPARLRDRLVHAGIEALRVRTTSLTAQGVAPIFSVFPRALSGSYVYKVIENSSLKGVTLIFKVKRGESASVAKQLKKYVLTEKMPHPFDLFELQQNVRNTACGISRMTNQEKKRKGDFHFFMFNF